MLNSDGVICTGPEAVEPEAFAAFRTWLTGMDKKGLTSPQAFQPPPSVVPIPEGGAPALHGAGGAELDDHLKVSTDHDSA